MNTDDTSKMVIICVACVSLYCKFCAELAMGPAWLAIVPEACHDVFL